MRSRDFIAWRSSPLPGRLERDHLRALVPLATGRRGIDPVRDHLDRVPSPAVLLPGPALQSAGDPDAPALGEVLRAELGLAVPGRHPDEVRAGLPLPRPTARRSSPPWVGADFLELDVGGEVADQLTLFIRARR